MGTTTAVAAMRSLPKLADFTIAGKFREGGARDYRPDAIVDAAPIASAVRQYCFRTERVRWPVISATVRGLTPFNEDCVTRPARKLWAAILAMADAGKPARFAARFKMRGIESGLRRVEICPCRSTPR